MTDWTLRNEDGTGIPPNNTGDQRVAGLFGDPPGKEPRRRVRRLVRRIVRDAVSKVASRHESSDIGMTESEVRALHEQQKFAVKRWRDIGRRAVAIARETVKKRPYCRHVQTARLATEEHALEEILHPQYPAESLVGSPEQIADRRARLVKEATNRQYWHHAFPRLAKIIRQTLGHEIEEKAPAPKAKTLKECWDIEKNMVLTESRKSLCSRCIASTGPLCHECNRLMSSLRPVGTTIFSEFIASGKPN
jgi:hypothetical protein